MHTCLHTSPHTCLDSSPHARLLMQVKKRVRMRGMAGIILPGDYEYTITNGKEYYIKLMTQKQYSTFFLSLTKKGRDWFIFIFLCAGLSTCLYTCRSGRAAHGSSRLGTCLYACVQRPYTHACRSDKAPCICGGGGSCYN